MSTETGGRRGGRGTGSHLGLLSCFLACACGLHLVAPPGTGSASLRPIQERLARIRGLSFSPAVPSVRIPPEEARARRAANLDNQRAGDELALLSRLYAHLGLVPRDTDLREVTLGLYRDDFTDYYDPRRGEIVVVEHQTPDGFRTRALEALLGRKARHEGLLVYELTRALHQQHFPGALDRPPLGADDRTLAAQAVLEGDAVLTTFAYAGGTLDAEHLGRLADEVSAKSIDTAGLDPPVPPGIRDIIVFPYLAGVAFVARALGAHGWAGVDALIIHPPRSTEQVLHPERYYGETDDPQSVQLPALHDRGGREWPILGEWTLGELRIRALLARAMTAATAQQAAEGWDGDRLRALEVDKGLGLVWLTVWDDPGGAAEFFEAYRTLLAARYPEAPPAGGAARVESPSGDSTSYLLEHRDQRVLAIEGLPGEERAALAEQVWEHAILIPEGPELPWLDLAAAESHPLRPAARGAASMRWSAAHGGDSGRVASATQPR